MKEGKAKDVNEYIKTIKLDEVTYGIMIKNYAVRNDKLGAQKVLMEMYKKDVPIKIRTINATINAFACTGDEKGALAIYRFMTDVINNDESIFEGK